MSKANYACAVEDGAAGHRLGVGEQDRFEVDLINPVRWFGCRPPCVGAIGRGVAIGATGDRDARELDPGGGEAIGDVVGVVVR